MPPPTCSEITPADVCRELTVSRFTVHRWLKVGVKGVRLKARMAGGRWRIDRSDLEAFRDQLTADALPTQAAPVPKRSRPAAEARQAADAIDRLKARGVRIPAIPPTPES
jgi:excisionase family DNA binding protein